MAVSLIIWGVVAVMLVILAVVYSALHHPIDRCPHGYVDHFECEDCPND